MCNGSNTSKNEYDWVKIEHLSETESLRNKDGQRFSNLKKTKHLQTVVQFHSDVPQCKIASTTNIP